MLELFDRENGVYVMPSGVTKTSAQMKEDPQYAILFNKICVVDVNDGILFSYNPLGQLAAAYGIEVDEVTDDNSESILQNVKDEIQRRKDLEAAKPQPNVMAASTRVAQIMAMSFTDEQALEVKDIYPEYQVDHAYKQGDFFTHEGELYKVNQAHTSASQWEPGSVGTESLYTHLTLNEDGYPIWKQPTGAHDAYNKGDIVEYNGELYKSLIDGNAYSPDVYPAGWEKYTEPTE